MEKKLWRLTDDELRIITKNVGIKFTGGDENLEKEDFIRVLDEVQKEDLIREYNNIKDVN
jgi:hypothetical protein